MPKLSNRPVTKSASVAPPNSRPLPPVNTMRADGCSRASFATAVMRSAASLSAIVLARGRYVGRHGAAEHHDAVRRAALSDPISGSALPAAASVHCRPARCRRPRAAEPRRSRAPARAGGSACASAKCRRAPRASRRLDGSAKKPRTFDSPNIAISRWSGPSPGATSSAARLRSASRFVVHRVEAGQLRALLHLAHHPFLVAPRARRLPWRRTRPGPAGSPPRRRHRRR